MNYETFEWGDTVQFTWTSSVAPDAAPTLKVARRDAPTSYTIVTCVAAIQSSTTQYYALYTMPNSDQEMRGEWFAQKTVSGSAYNFIVRFGFLVRQV